MSSENVVPSLVAGGGTGQIVEQDGSCDGYRGLTVG